MTNNKGGRPTKLTPELVEKLERAFASGFTDEQACLFVDIDKKTLYNYCDKNPDFSTKKEELKKKPNLKAKLNIINDINNGDINSSKWWLERKSKDEFSTRVENINQDTDELELFDNDRMREIKERAESSSQGASN